MIGALAVMWWGQQHFQEDREDHHANWVGIITVLLALLPWSFWWFARAAGLGRAVSYLAAAGGVGVVVLAGWAAGWWWTPVLWLGSTIVAVGVISLIEWRDQHREAMYNDNNV